MSEERYFVSRQIKAGVPAGWLVRDHEDRDHVAAGPFKTQNSARINAMALNQLVTYRSKAHE